MSATDMAKESTPTVIKKYANRRLYHTGTSTYVTLEDLAQMIQKGEDFTVQDAKTGDDITRNVLTQIIFEQENKGTNLLPIAFLRQLIGFYGDSLQTIVPSYLESAMQRFSQDQQKIRAQFAQSFGPTAFHAIEDQVRQNMAMFQEAMKMFTPFGAVQAAKKATEEAESGQTDSRPKSSDLDDLKSQLADMQRKIDALANKD